MAAPKLMTIKDVASRLGVSRESAKRIVREMPYYNVSGGAKNEFVRVTEAALDAWLKEHEKVPEQPAMQLHGNSRKPPRQARYDPNLFEADGRVKRRRA